MNTNCIFLYISFLVTSVIFCSSFGILTNVAGRELATKFNDNNKLLDNNKPITDNTGELATKFNDNNKLLDNNQPLTVINNKNPINTGDEISMLQLQQILSQRQIAIQTTSKTLEGIQNATHSIVKNIGN